MKFGALSAAILGLGLAGTQAATFTVSTPDDSGPGSLRSAILAAEALPGPELIVLSNLTGTITIVTPLPTISEAVTIAGPGRDLLMISGAGACRIFVCSGPSTAISDLTVANGLAPLNEDGGAILNTGNLTLTGCALLNNGTRGGFGGAIANHGNLSMSLTVLACNVARGGDGTSGAGGGGGLGGAVFTSSGEFRATDCGFTGNQAVGGNGGEGGVYGPGLGTGGGLNGGGPGTPGGFGGGGGSAATLHGPGGVGGVGGGGGSGANYTGAGIWWGAPRGLGGGQGAGSIGGWAGGGGGGAGIGGAVFIHSGTAFLVNDTFSNNVALPGLGGSGGGMGYAGHDGTGIQPDLYRYGGTILPRLSATASPVRCLGQLERSLSTVRATTGTPWT